MTKLAKDVRFDEDLMWVDFTDGSCLGVNLAHFPRLLRATPEQRAGVVISGGGQGLHWDALDEDVDVVNLMMGMDTRHHA